MPGVTEAVWTTACWNVQDTTFQRNRFPGGDSYFLKQLVKWFASFHGGGHILKNELKRFRIWIARPWRQIGQLPLDFVREISLEEPRNAPRFFSFTLIIVHSSSDLRLLSYPLCRCHSKVTFPESDKPNKVAVNQNVARYNLPMLFWAKSNIIIISAL